MTDKKKTKSEQIKHGIEALKRIQEIPFKIKDNNEHSK